MGYVIDASVALAWLLPDEENLAVRKLAAKVWQGKKSIIAPPLFFAEVLNGLLMAHRRKRLTAPQLAASVDLLLALPVKISDTLHSKAAQLRVLDMALQHELTIYDAQYLVLAQSQGYTILSLDRALIAAAKAYHIPFAPG